MDENKEYTDENLNSEIPAESAAEAADKENMTQEETASSVNVAEQQLAEEKDKYLRLFADFENYKKRSQREKLDFFQYANEDLMVSLLAVLDDFERALKEISKNGDEENLKGVELIYQKLKHKLTEKGLKAMEISPGDHFDVDYHEAITQIPAPSEELKGKIVDVVETGYLLNEKVIRFAKVVTGN